MFFSLALRLNLLYVCVCAFGLTERTISVSSFVRVSACVSVCSCFSWLSISYTTNAPFGILKIVVNVCVFTCLSLCV